jgi:hypothetical protein
VLCEVLRLVIPRSYVLALGLGLVASEVCIPLIQRYLHAPCLYSVGLVVLRNHTNRACGVATTVYRREQGPRHFDRKLDSEDGGERSGRGLPEGTLETYLHMGKARRYPRSYPTGSLALVRDSLQGAPMRTRGSLSSVKILESSMGVCISTSSLPSASTLLPWLCALLS